ncbi:MAG: VaFE repeat-containing surface-anchored protein, partial [Acutalibacteraceae bacterium]|nr:VaFE repeat-containing surface-anchored protein [Acutalibacteraceae bacterium]
VEGFTFRLTCEALNYSKEFTTDENGFITANKLKAGTYKIEEILPADSIYEQPKAQTITIEYPKTAKEFNTPYKVNFKNIPKDGYAKIIKTSESNNVEGFEFNLTGVDYLGNSVIYTALKTDKDGLIQQKIKPGTYTVEEINVPSYFEQPEAQSITVKANETATVEFYNQFVRGYGQVQKTSDDGKVEGLHFRLTGTADCGRIVNKDAYTNADGIAEFNRILVGTYTLEEIDTPEQYKPFEPVTVRIEEDKTTYVTAHNTFCDVPGKIIKTSEDGKIEGIEFRITNDALGYDKTFTTDANGVITTNLYPTTYKVTELNAADYYIPQATKELVVNPYNSESDIATVEFENLLKKGTVRVQKTADDNVIENVEFRIFGVSTAGTTINMFAKTNANGVAEFNNIPIGNYTLFEINQPDRYIVVIEQDFDVSWDETSTMIVENNLKKGEIKTTAKDNDTGNNYAYANTKTTIVDTVNYKDLGTNTEYTVKGVLMDKATGKALEISGEQVTATKTFTTSETGTGTVNVEFTFDSSALVGKSVVVFEQLYYNGVELASHKDITDKGQTVTFKDPEIKTTAKDILTDGHDTYVNDKTTIVDTVEYKNLIASKEYKLFGKLMDKSTGDIIKINNTDLVSEITFIPETENGTVDVSFTFDSTSLKGKDIVAFEYLYFNENEIATHTDINDEGQTIKFVEPKIGTTAKDKSTNTHNAKVSKTTTIIDTVTYENLVVGKEYTVKGALMVKETGKALVVNGKEITAEKTFTATSENGSVDIEFTFDSTALEGKSVVAFETIYFNDLEIATHSDLNDKYQTVTFDKPEEPTQPATTTSTVPGDNISSNVPGDSVSTGDITSYYALLSLVVVIISLIVIVIFRKKLKE